MERNGTMKPPLHLLATLSAALMIAACERTPATIMTQNPSHAPRPTCLSSEIRDRLGVRFDVAALEELLGTMPASEQQDLLNSLGASGTAPAGGETRDVSVPVRSTDPVRQALLDRVWAPFWETLPPEMLDRIDLPYPGRELAKARRAARTSRNEQ